MSLNRKLGRLPGKIPVGLRELGYYSPGPLPKAPASFAVPEVSGWGILGNDQYGDCGVAGLEHGFMADAADTFRTETFASDAQAVSYYLTYTGGQDSGVVLSDYLAYVREQGYYGHTVSAYAPVGVHDVPALQSAISMYDFAYCGITVTQGMQEAYENGEPWTMATLESPVDGGHCVPAVGYDDQFLYVVTWGTMQPVTWPAWHYMSSEAWAVITGELSARGGDGHGIKYDALVADLDRLAA